MHIPIHSRRPTNAQCQYAFVLLRLKKLLSPVKELYTLFLISNNCMESYSYIKMACLIKVNVQEDSRLYHFFLEFTPYSAVTVHLINITAILLSSHKGCSGLKRKNIFPYHKPFVFNPIGIFKTS